MDIFLPNIQKMDIIIMKKKYFFPRMDRNFAGPKNKNLKI
jgi:hypothetical protein